MSQAVIKSLFAQRSRDFLKDVLSRYTDEGPKAPDILLVVKTTHPGVDSPTTSRKNIQRPSIWSSVATAKT